MGIFPERTQSMTLGGVARKFIWHAFAHNKVHRVSCPSMLAYSNRPPYLSWEMTFVS